MGCLGIVLQDGSWRQFRCVPTSLDSFANLAFNTHTNLHVVMGSTVSHCSGNPSMLFSSFGFKDAAAAAVAVVCCVFIFVCLCNDVWCVGQSAIAPGWEVRTAL